MPIYKLLNFIVLILISKKKRYLSEKMLLLQQIVRINVLQATPKYEYKNIFIKNRSLKSV